MAASLFRKKIPTDENTGAIGPHSQVTQEERAPLILKDTRAKTEPQFMCNNYFAVRFFLEVAWQVLSCSRSVCSVCILRSVLGKINVRHLAREHVSTRARVAHP